MTALAPHVTAFFQERLPLERAASVNTCDSYAYAFKLLLDYASKKLRFFGDWAPKKWPCGQLIHQTEHV